MVMVGYAGKHRAHVAVVRRLVTPREIRVDHANWLNDGAIYVNDPVVDVSLAASTMGRGVVKSGSPKPLSSSRVGRISMVCMKSA